MSELSGQNSCSGRKGELTRPANRNILMGRMEKYFCDTGLNMNVHQSTETASRHCYKGEGETGTFLCHEVYMFQDTFLFNFAFILVKLESILY